jgi:hypothetical protein
MSKAASSWNPDNQFAEMDQTDSSSTLNQTEAGLRQCPFCVLAFLTDDYYFQHVFEAHSELVAANWFQCKSCQAYFPSRSDRYLKIKLGTVSF